MKTATFTKLKDGSWGLKVNGEPRPGDKVEVEKRDGSTETHEIAVVLWTGKDRFTATTVSLAKIAPKASSRRSGGNYRGGGRRECRTGGNCSSFGSGRSCGASDCDGY